MVRYMRGDEEREGGTVKQYTVGDLRDALEGVSDEEPLWTMGWDDGLVSLYWGKDRTPILEDV